MSKESTVKVSLDLNEELREYAVKRLAQFRTEHRDCAANVLCDLPQLNRELCGAVCDHLKRHSVLRNEEKDRRYMRH